MEAVIDLSNPKEKALLVNSIRGLEGPHRVEIVKYRKRRSDAQNRFYWPCVVAYFGDYLRAQGEFVTDKEAHTLLKSKFLRRTVIDPGTGEVLGEALRSTADLSSEEMGEYLEACAAWLAEQFGVIVPEPSTYRLETTTCQTSTK